MSVYVNTIKYEPEWDPPQDDDITEMVVDERFFKRVSQFHVGLKYINVTPKYRDSDSGSSMQCAMQKFLVKGAGKNKRPGISPDELARVIVCWAQEQCDGLDQGEVLYDCFFDGDSDDLKGPFHKRGSFRLRPDDADEDDDKSDNKDAKSNEQAPTLPGAQAAPVTSSSESPRPSRRTAVVSAGIPAPSNAVESEIIQLLRAVTQSQQVITQNQHALFTEQQASIAANTQSCKELISSAVELFTVAKDEVQHQRAEITRANDRLIKMSERHASQHEGEKKILNFAMDLFVESMRGQWNSLNRDMSWERQIMYQQFDSLAEKYKKESRFEMLKEFSPLLMAVGGSILENMGSGAGKVMQQIAAVQSPEPPDPDPEPPKRPPPRRPTPTNMPQGQYAAQRFNEHPVASMLTLFGSMIADKQELVKDALGDEHYDLLQKAIQAADDAEARTRGSKFFTALLPHGRPKLEAVLDDKQRELFADIHTKVFGTRGPETISEKASVAELRTMAKEKHGLTFPSDATKEEILAEIERAS